MSRSVLALLGDKPGDNAQCLALAEAVGAPFETTRLERDLAAAPWPALVIAAGRRGEQAALAMRARAPVRIVLIGRPRPPFARFDLIVAAPQFELPALPNVIALSLPLHPLPDAARSAEAKAWQPGVQLPRPWIALLVGGSARPYRLDVAAAQRLARLASEAARAAGGALLVTTSRRTPPEVADALETALCAPRLVHRWAPGAPVNPYPALLAQADRFIVTGDSASMACEAVATGRPVALFLPAARSGLRARALQRLRGAAVRSLAPDGSLLQRALADLVQRAAIRPPRDLARLQRTLVEHGFAHVLGQQMPARPPPVSADALLARELARVAERVRLLLAEPAPALAEPARSPASRSPAHEHRR